MYGSHLSSDGRSRQSVRSLLRRSMRVFRFLRLEDFLEGFSSASRSLSFARADSGFQSHFDSISAVPV